MSRFTKRFQNGGLGTYILPWDLILNQNPEADPAGVPTSGMGLGEFYPMAFSAGQIIDILTKVNVFSFTLNGNTANSQTMPDAQWLYENFPADPGIDDPFAAFVFPNQINYNLDVSQSYYRGVGGQYSVSDGSRLQFGMAMGVAFGFSIPPVALYEGELYLQISDCQITDATTGNVANLGAGGGNVPVSNALQFYDQFANLYTDPANPATGTCSIQAVSRFP